MQSISSEIENENIEPEKIPIKMKKSRKLLKKEHITQPLEENVNEASQNNYKNSKSFTRHWLKALLKRRNSIEELDLLLETEQMEE